MEEEQVEENGTDDNETDGENSSEEENTNSIDYGGKDRETIPWGKRVGKVPLKITEFTEGTEEEYDCKIVDDYKIEYTNVRGEKKKVFIYDTPKVAERVEGGLFRKRKRYLMFYTTYRSEATHDPEKTAIDLPTVEIANKYIIELIKSDVPVALMKSVDLKKRWYEYLPYILLFLSPIIMCWLVWQMLTGGG